MVDPMCGVGTILIEAAQEHKVRTEIYRASVCLSEGRKRTNKTSENLWLHILRSCCPGVFFFSYVLYVNAKNVV